MISKCKIVNLLYPNTNTINIHTNTVTHSAYTQIIILMNCVCVQFAIEFRKKHTKITGKK